MDFVWDNPGKPVPEETFTHSYLSWSSIITYLLHPSTTIHGILPVWSMCLTVFFHNLSPSFLWSTSWPGILHFILHTFQVSLPCNRLPGTSHTTAVQSPSHFQWYILIHIQWYQMPECIPSNSAGAAEQGPFWSHKRNYSIEVSWGLIKEMKMYICKLCTAK